MSRTAATPNQNATADGGLTLRLQSLLKLIFLLLAVTAGIAGCCSRSPASPDAIDLRMLRLSEEAIVSYVFQPIDLPRSASPQQLVAALSKRYDLHWSDLKIATYKIVKVVDAELGARGSARYTVVLLDTNIGQKIVLFQPMTNTGGKWGGWYNRICDTKPSA